MIGYSSGQDRHILPARDFPRLSREKKLSFDHEINPSTLLWVHRNAKFYSNNTLESKKRELGFAFFAQEK